MKLFYSLILFALLFINCESNSNQKFWEISKFKINEKILVNKEEVKLLYCSRGLNYKEDLNYFVHVIVVSQKLAMQ